MPAHGPSQGGRAASTPRAVKDSRSHHDTSPENLDEESPLATNGTLPPAV